MRIQSVIFAALATACCGNLEPADFDIEKYDLIQGELENALPNSISETDATVDIAALSEADCEDMCQFVLQEDGKIYNLISTLDDCTVTATEVDPSAVEGGDDVVATLSCSGVYTPECIGGRRPLCHRPAELSEGNILGTQLAGMAHMETVSVTAFEELAQQLSSLGAPKDFINRCRSAANDERLHAALLNKLANRYGGSFNGEALPCDTGASLLDIALHNAVEGCVNEAWAACLAAHQARAATDATIRRVFAQIARDEVRHAQLAWDLHGWMLSQLTEAEQALVQEAQQEAIDALQQQQVNNDNAMTRFIGLPDANTNRRLKAAFAQELAA